MPRPSSPTPLAVEAPTDRRSELVLLAGGVTTLVALAGVYALARTGTNIMGWYANYVIPIGALVVGLVAASGYGVAAWMSGLKMNTRLMWSVVGQLALSYLIAQYEQFRSFVPETSDLGFWAWFDESTRAFAWERRGGVGGQPLGVLGYGLRALEVVGFVGGGVLVPLGLRSKPYCDPCRSYKRTRRIAALAAGVQQRTFGRVNAAANDEEHGRGMENLTALFGAAASGERARFEEELLHRSTGSRAAGKLTGHIRVSLVRCPRCSDGGLEAALVTGQGNNIRVTRIGAQPLDKERVKDLFD